MNKLFRLTAIQRAVMDKLTRKAESRQKYMHEAYDTLQTIVDLFDMSNPIPGRGNEMDAALKRAREIFRKINDEVQE